MPENAHLPFPGIFICTVEAAIHFDPSLAVR